MEADDQREHTATKKSGSFVTCIGASAGGLEALEQFFTHCPTDTGSAFVVVQHLSPDHKSMMQDLLQRYTEMEIVTVADGMRLRANAVFLIPAGQIMRLKGRTFQLTPKEPHKLTLPIDIFFTSMSNEIGARSVGIILSGTGSDGTRGAAAINEAGGFLLAQDPKTSKFDGMPSSVIATGLIDAVLDAKELPARLVSHLKAVPVTALINKPHSTIEPLSEDAAFDGVLFMLKQHSGIDFNDYKIATLLRRIERRMQVRHCNTVETYHRLLEDDEKEISILRKELLIPVTKFFRDTETFEVFEDQIVDELVGRAQNGQALRIWVAGTSTGEEAYSIAMLFIEAFERHRRWPTLKIFATDVSQESIEIASNGRYASSIASEVTDERLGRFFTQIGDSYQVTSELRETIVFAKHNLLVDPPFTQIDLLSCRNTMIYFLASAQLKVMKKFEFATKPGGFLMLGSSESITIGDKYFTPFNSKHKLFTRSEEFAFSGISVSETMRGSYRSGVPRTPRQHKGFALSEHNLIDTATEALIKQYAPPSMLVDDKGQIIHLFGDLQPFIRMRDGAASLEMSRVLPEQLIAVATALTFKASRDKVRLVSDFIPLPSGSGRMLTRLTVAPVKAKNDGTLLLISFEEKDVDAHNEATTPVDLAQETVERIEGLERELLATRESLQATIEELETSNEELQATNEELMASNEELQSSNEELQSVNEELNTVNSEYQEKVNILNRVNADLDGMTKAVAVATVFVDHNTALTRYSPDALAIFRLRESDLGRPLGEISNTLADRNIIDDLERVIVSERMLEAEVKVSDGQLYLMRIHPYKTTENRAGAVATFIDITAFKDRERLQGILNALPEHIAVLSEAGEIQMVNSAWNRFARANGDAALVHTGIGCNYLDVCRPIAATDVGDGAKAYQGIKSVLEGSAAQYSQTYPCHGDGEERWFVMNVVPINSTEHAAVVSHIDISAWYNTERTR